MVGAFAVASQPERATTDGDVIVPPDLLLTKRYTSTALPTGCHVGLALVPTFWNRMPLDAEMTTEPGPHRPANVPEDPLVGSVATECNSTPLSNAIAPTIAVFFVMRAEPMEA